VVNDLSPLLGLVLTGGQSRRMGADKALLEIDGVSLLARAVSTLKPVVDNVYVSVRSAQRDEAERSCHALIEDQFEGIGPAAGLLSAHLHSPDSAWLVVACDMPLLDTDTLRGLIAARTGSQTAIAWASPDGTGPEPLCAIYEPSTLAAFLEQVNEGGDPSPRVWLASTGATLLTETRPEVLSGTNTQEEFTLLTERLNAQTSALSRKNND
jgi:molybdopterin-guanine dinucleotide biosynthesis protein A